MERNGVSPDVITYNAAIMALSRNRRWKEALGPRRALEQYFLLICDMTKLVPTKKKQLDQRDPPKKHDIFQRGIYNNFMLFCFLSGSFFFVFWWVILMATKGPSGKHPNRYDSGNGGSIFRASLQSDSVEHQAIDQIFWENKKGHQ